MPTQIGGDFSLNEEELESRAKDPQERILWKLSKTWGKPLSLLRETLTEQDLIESMFHLREDQKRTISERERWRQELDARQKGHTISPLSDDPTITLDEKQANKAEFEKRMEEWENGLDIKNADIIEELKAKNG